MDCSLRVPPTTSPRGNLVTGKSDIARLYGPNTVENSPPLGSIRCSVNGNFALGLRPGPDDPQWGNVLICDDLLGSRIDPGAGSGWITVLLARGWAAGPESF